LLGFILGGDQANCLVTRAIRLCDLPSLLIARSLSLIGHSICLSL